MSQWGILLIPAFALVQLVAGVTGIANQWGWGWSVAAVVVAVWWRFTLPLTVGTYLGATEVWDWPWYFALLIALPGLLVLLPGVAGWMVDGVAQLLGKKKNPGEMPPVVQDQAIEARRYEPHQAATRKPKLLGDVTKALAAIGGAMAFIVVVGLIWKAHTAHRNEEITRRLQTVATMLSDCTDSSTSSPTAWDISQVLLYLDDIHLRQQGDAPRPTVSCAAVTKVQQDLEFEANRRP